jgi:malonate-semialdehyde dehydrogenase (acetylating)/methylmalonate-semialdehyde dehydrogenase
MIKSASRVSVAPGPEALASRIAHWIDGKSAAFSDDREQEVFDPALGTPVATVALGSSIAVDAAVVAAARAFPGWRDTPLSQRMPLMYRLREALAGNADELARLIATQHGKMVSDALGEVQRGIEVVEFACSAPTALKGEFSEQVASGVDTFSIRQPLGVCVGITPFNFPAMVPLWMFPIAIVCGNTFVLKPSERDPSASIFIARLLAEAGFPPGVLNVVHGDKVAVDALLDHPQVAAVSFVGSTPVARHVYARAAQAGKRVQALGGAKNHLVVLPDADLDQAADAIVSAAFGSAGQRCMAGPVAVAVGDIADQLVTLVADRAGRLQTGPASNPQSEMGPIVSRQALDRVTGYIEQGLSEGAELVADGRDPSLDDSAGFFVGPTIFDRVHEGMSVYADEIFGPILSVVRVPVLEDALSLIERNNYGNGASLFTRSGPAARRFQREVAAGMVGINVAIPVPVGYYSFGGWNDSLFGDSHVYGPEGFHFYTRGKVITSRWPSDELIGVSLTFPTS